MKKILTLSLVLFSTVMFANGTDDDSKAAAASGTALIKKDANTFRLIYKAEKQSNVRVSIYDANDQLVYSEKVNNTDGFTRPYNFENLGEGDYTIAIENGSKKQIEKVSYHAPKVTKTLNVIKMSSDEGKYFVMAAGQGEEQITVSVFDGEHNLVHKSIEATDGNFSKIYNLKSLKGHLTFEISNENGEVKSVAY
jgi:flagellar hook assembly protein FlgD